MGRPGKSSGEKLSRLVQTHVTMQTGKDLATAARNEGMTEAAYLRRLIERNLHAIKLRGVQ